ncbi:hypothetical protein SeMB42_g02066 [Synchytrium endobioticum]|uniref:Uncharacterized protein n=1 Tax=Synchytrium endobioticum TaxID=286115 RepID=A0A507DI79_9FUNG|nr:hypothetical protein SeMB42_g02066 [Synchytrium endobioticum]
MASKQVNTWQRTTENMSDGRYMRSMLSRKPILSVGVGVNAASNPVKSTIMQSFSWLLADELLSATGRNGPRAESPSTTKPKVDTLGSSVATNSATNAAVYKPRKTPRRQKKPDVPTPPAPSKLQAGSNAGTAHSETDIKELFAATNGYRRNTIDPSTSEAAKRFLAPKQPSLHRDTTSLPKVTVECSSSKWNATLVNFRKRAFKRSWSDATLGDDVTLAPASLKRQRSDLNCQLYGGNGPFIKRKIHLEGVGKENIPPCTLSTNHIPQAAETMIADELNVITRESLNVTLIVARLSSHRCALQKRSC